MSLPSLSEKNKDIFWHKRYAREIVKNSITDSWAIQYKLMEECDRFLDAGSDGALTSHLQRAEDGTELPAFWITLNTLKTKMELLIGELEERGNEIKVTAVNKEAVARKIDEKERVRTLIRIQEIKQLVESQTGLMLEDTSGIPQSELELDEYFDLSVKDKAEILMYYALKFCNQYNDWPEERKALFRDVLSKGRCFVRNEIYRGVPRGKRVNPLSMVFDTSAQTDNLEDATYFAEVNYMGIPEAVERYGLTEEEIKTAQQGFSEFLNGMHQDTFGYISEGRLKWFDNDKVLVIRACWKDYNVTNHKDEGDFIKEIKEVRKKDVPKTTSKRREVWRQATIIGGDIVKEWGEVPNQPRDLDDLEKTEAPYKGWIPNFGIGRGVSKVEQLVGLQLLKDISMYNIQLAMSRAGGRGIVYDLAMAPANWSPEQVMKYLKVHGIAYINSKESQLMPGNMNPFKEFDMSLSTSITQYIQIMQYIDSEMAAISGVSPEREGFIQGASQGASVTQSALYQSNLVTAPLFRGFERFCSRVMNHQAKLVKIAWAGKEVFAPIIGDSGIDFLKENVDLDLDTFVVIESLPPTQITRQKLEAMLNIAIQSDPSFVDDALDILIDSDLTSAVRKFKKKRALRKMYQEQQQQMMAEREQMIDAQVKEMEMQKGQQQIQGNLMLQDKKNEGNLQKTAMTGQTKLTSQQLANRTKLTSDKIGVIKDIRKEQINATTQKKAER